MGSWCWLAGRQQPALRWWLKAAKSAEALEMKPEMARSYLEIGRHLNDGEARSSEFEGLNGDAWIERAEELFRELGLDVETAEPRAV